MHLVPWWNYFVSMLDAQVFLDCAEGLKVLHGARVVHGDISPATLGLISRWSVGSSSILTSRGRLATPWPRKGSMVVLSTTAQACTLELYLMCCRRGNDEAELFMIPKWESLLALLYSQEQWSVGNFFKAFCFNFSTSMAKSTCLVLFPFLRLMMSILGHGKA